MSHASSNAFIEGWLSSEAAEFDKISVKRAYIDINDGNLADGLAFSQIMYWHGRNLETGQSRLRVFRDGHYWMSKGYDEWWDECRIQPRAARDCVARIKGRGLIIVKLFKFNGIPRVHIRVDWDAFESLIRRLLSNPIRRETSNGIDGKRQMGSTGNVKWDRRETSTPLTETIFSETTHRDHSKDYTADFQKNEPNTKQPAPLSLNCETTDEDVTVIGKDCQEGFDRLQGMLNLNLESITLSDGAKPDFELEAEISSNQDPEPQAEILNDRIPKTPSPLPPFPEIEAITRLPETQGENEGDENDDDRILRFWAENKPASYKDCKKLSQAQKRAIEACIRKYGSLNQVLWVAKVVLDYKRPIATNSLALENVFRASNLEKNYAEVQAAIAAKPWLQLSEEERTEFDRYILSTRKWNEKDSTDRELICKRLKWQDSAIVCWQDWQDLKASPEEARRAVGGGNPWVNADGAIDPDFFAWLQSKHSDKDRIRDSYVWTKEELKWRGMDYWESWQRRLARIAEEKASRQAELEILQSVDREREAKRARGETAPVSPIPVARSFASLLRESIK